MAVDYNIKLFPNRLKVIRQNAGLQQKHVATMLGHNTGVTLCDWENAKFMPNGANLIKLCVLYRKAPWELFPEYCNQIAEDFNEVL